MQKIRKVLQSIADNPQRVIVATVILMMLVSIPIILIILGFDQTIVPTSIEGYVTDTEGNAIEGARISSQGEEAFSEANGYFLLEGIAYGYYEVKIEANGYATLAEEIRLERFGNSAEFKLEKLEFGQVMFEINLPEDNPFYASEFSITLNNEELEFSDTLKVESERLLVGDYTLRVKSPYYKDITTDIEITAGTVNKIIELVPAADLVAEVKDWLTGEGLEPATVEIKRTEVFQVIDSEFIGSDGTITLTDLDTSGSVILRLKRSGYHTLERSQVLEQGQNSLGTLHMIPDGKIVTVKDDGFNRQIFVSDFNGRRPQNVATTALSCDAPQQTSAAAIVRCGSGTFTYLHFGGETVVSSTLGSVQADVIDMQVGGNVVVAADNDEPGKLFALPASDSGFGTEATVLYDDEEDVTSIKVLRDLVVFTTTDGVWKVKTDGSELERISNGQFTVESINPVGNELYALLLLPSSSGSHIWSINLQTNEKTRMTQLPARHGSLQFINDKEFIYVSNKSEGIDSLYSQSLDSTLSRLVRKNVADVTLIGGTGNVLLKQDGTRYILNLDARNLAKVNL